jgi:hypothetical protein
MFANIRRYCLARGSMDEFMRRVDESFVVQLAAQDGFVAYQAIELGGGEFLTVSMFREPRQAEASRELAQRWLQTELEDMDVQRLETLRSEIDVSRASEDLLEPLHAASGSEFCALRRYVLRDGSIDELLRRVDTSFAERVQEIDGFRGYMVLELGNDELVSLTFFRDQEGVETSEALSARFVAEELAEFDLERTAAVAGDVRVNRAGADVLLAEHA